ncbi:MAG: diaminopimelate decarboxylase [Candidatus Gastranaerophilales bacterium]|nr:diaminopimelate decarboxylase [Candidatus Gastranaerophilales bacterium]
MQETKTDNQSIMPYTAKINKENHLEIGGCDCVDLVDTYGSPLYVADEQTVRRICRQYKEAFASYKNINMMYANKAFASRAMCRLMAQEGFGLDVVSGGELYTALKSDFDCSKILFNGNNKTQEELEMAIDNGVGRISADNFLELALLDNILKSKNKTQDILLRITPGIECHTHEYIQTGHLDSKFGFDLTQLKEAVELIRDEYTNLNLKGLHAHIGSQIFETQVYYDEVQVFCETFKKIRDEFGIELTEMNIGGGLGVTYIKEDTPPSIFKIADVIIKSIKDGMQKYDIKEEPVIYIEPGRSIIATAGVTLYTVGSSKVIPQTGKKYVAVDGGMADNPRPSMYQAEYSAVVANNVNDDNKEIVTIAGRFCESGDILIKDIELPITQEGDIICVFNTGAYGYSMSSNYNRVLKPAMVLVNNGQSDIIIRRQSYDDLICHDEIPQRL